MRIFGSLRDRIARTRLIQSLARHWLPLIPIAIALGSNIIVWIIVLLLLHNRTELLGTGVLAYTYGLRHALDADHISAIDNLTRRLIEEGQRPVTVGLWFSLGHSTVVMVTCIAIAATSAALVDKFDNFQAVGGVIGTSVSMSFLLLIGFANCYVLYKLVLSLRRELQHTRRRRIYGHETGALEPTPTIKHTGILFRIFSRLFRLIDRPWKMYPLGILFGLGFDTSTEVALLGIASVQGAAGTPVYLIMIYPVLFTVGMLLIDTLDGAAMVFAYTAATVTSPHFSTATTTTSTTTTTTSSTTTTSTVKEEGRVGRLYYALILTAMSVIVALTIGTLQFFTLLHTTLHPTPRGAFWDGVDRAGDSYDIIGGAICGAFAVVVLASGVVHYVLYKRHKRKSSNATNYALRKQNAEEDKSGKRGGQLEGVAKGDDQELDAQVVDGVVYGEVMARDVIQSKGDHVDIKQLP